MLNSAVLAPPVTWCPQMPQKLLSLPWFFHASSTATLSFLAVHRCHRNSCLCLGSFTPRVLQLSPFWLSTDATGTTVSAFVLSSLEYCNSLLSGCPQYLLARLQEVQSNAARLVLRLPKTDRIAPHLASLHWRPIDPRMQHTLISLLQQAVSFRPLLTT